MIHNYISSKVIVGETYVNYGIKSSGWEGNAPLWLYHALGDLGINRFTIDREPVVLEFEEGRFQIPAEATLVDRIHFFKPHVYDINNMPDIYKDVIGNELKVHFSQRGEWIHVRDLEEGVAIVKYKSLPAHLDEETDLTFPVIPNDEHLKKALRVYLLMQILMTGYSHPVYNLTVNNPWVNPQFMYEQAKKKAKISVARMDSIDAHKNSRLINTFISPRLTKGFYLHEINR